MHGSVCPSAVSHVHDHRVSDEPADEITMNRSCYEKRFPRIWPSISFVAFALSLSGHDIFFVNRLTIDFLQSQGLVRQPRAVYFYKLRSDHASFLSLLFPVRSLFTPDVSVDIFSLARFSLRSLRPCDGL